MLNIEGSIKPIKNRMNKYFIIGIVLSEEVLDLYKHIRRKIQDFLLIIKYMI